MMKQKLKRATDKVCHIGILFVIWVWLSSMPDVATFFPDTKGVIATGCSITFTALPFLLLVATGIFSDTVIFHMFRLLLAAGTLACDIAVFTPRYLLVDADIISNRWSLILLPAFQLGILSALVLLYLAISRTGFRPSEGSIAHIEHTQAHSLHTTACQPSHSMHSEIFIRSMT